MLPVPLTLLSFSKLFFARRGVVNSLAPSLPLLPLSLLVFTIGSSSYVPSHSLTSTYVRPPTSLGSISPQFQFSTHCLAPFGLTYRTSPFLLLIITLYPSVFVTALSVFIIPFRHHHSSSFVLNATTSTTSSSTNFRKIAKISSHHHHPPSPSFTSTSTSFLLLRKTERILEQQITFR